MNCVLLRIVFALAPVILGSFSVAAHAQGISVPTLWTTQPIPVGQEFDASFGFRTNVSALGFWGDGVPPIVIEGNTLRIAFDEGCGFICPTNDMAYQQFPFRLPALPAGSYVVRIEASTATSEFPIVVVGGLPAPTALPVGGRATSLLGALLALAAIAALRRRNSSGSMR